MQMLAELTMPCSVRRCGGVANGLSDRFKKVRHLLGRILRYPASAQPDSALHRSSPCQRTWPLNSRLRQLGTGLLMARPIRKKATVEQLATTVAGRTSSEG